MLIPKQSQRQMTITYISVAFMKRTVVVIIYLLSRFRFILFVLFKDWINIGFNVKYIAVLINE
ncbi:hypothetical protein NIES4071_22010 [Calothrix sp. NIES-4071]|nr:hypothetical protein NIES4071_22010 [Calothrix sp. NIES-4071]BAZ56533.1 hypothetical protein NIES4105_21960 [Calothrix sp. NIES-4105]